MVHKLVGAAKLIAGRKKNIYTLCFMDFGKFKLVSIHNGGLVLDWIQFWLLPNLQNNICFKSKSKNHLALLITIRGTHCRNQLKTRKLVLGRQVDFTYRVWSSLN